MAKTVLDILDEIGESKSRLHKEAVIEKYKNDQDFLEVLDGALNPYIQYYMYKIPDYTPYAHVDLWIDETFALLRRLSERHVTGNNAIKLVEDMLSGLSEDEAEVIKRVIKKDLRVGVNAKTVNKVIPGLIPSFPCMLANSYTKKNLDRIKFPAYAQEKLDGMRVNIIVVKGKVSYRSRNGKLIELHSHSNAIFTNMAKITGDGVFDGEMLVERDGVILDRKTGNGILNKSVRKTMKFTITAEEAAMVKFVIWDFIPIKDFKNNVCTIPYSERYSTLVKTMKLMNSKIVSLVNTQQVDNQQHANDIFNEYLSKGSEGVILKNSDGPWEDKRATHQVKMKAELDADLKVISWVEGSGRLAGKMGSLICESEDGGLKVSVGSGFNDAQRESITPAEVIGKIITVKYNEKIKSKSKEENSLFLPIFVEFREDKDIANIDSEIK